MLLLSAAKKLQQYALLDVVVLVNGWRNGPGQAVINVRLLGQQLQQLNALWREDVILAKRYLMRKCFPNYQQGQAYPSSSSYSRLLSTLRK